MFPNDARKCVRASRASPASHLKFGSPVGGRIPRPACLDPATGESPNGRPQRKKCRPSCALFLDDPARWRLPLKRKMRRHSGFGNLRRPVAKDGQRRVRRRAMTFSQTFATDQDGCLGLANSAADRALAKWASRHAHPQGQSPDKRCRKPGSSKNFAQRKQFDHLARRLTADPPDSERLPSCGRDKARPACVPGPRAVRD